MKTPTKPQDLTTLQNIFPTVVLGWALGVFALLSIIGLMGVYFYYQDHILPNTYVNNQKISNLTLEEAKVVLNNLEVPSLKDHQIAVDDIVIASSASQLNPYYDTESIISELNTKTHISPFHTLLTIIQSFQSANYITANLKYDSNRLENMISELKIVVDDPNRAPSASLGISGNENSIEIDSGKIGRSLVVDETKQTIITDLQNNTFSTTATVASIGAELSEEQIEAAKERTAKLVGSQVKFTYEAGSFLLNDKQLISLLTFPYGIQFDVANELIANWEKTINREPQNAEFAYNPETLVVEKFTPPKNGLQLNTNQTQELLAKVLLELEEVSSEDAEEIPTYQLAIISTPPEKTLAETNDLGIRELIGVGDSHYDHSIPNRIHNVAITSDKINNVLIAPGQEFSFNKTVGEVSSRTGYKSAYVIMGGRTVLGDGGGVCQVSTTLFRSVLDAGLKVSKRLPHSYRVSYYELDRKPGVDATVYSGDVDFRFINDTDHHILVHSQADSENLYMKIELYGTSDGRSAEIVDHKTWGYTAPPPAQYYPDPSLPPGKLVQVDWPASGITASFTHIIKDKDGTVISEKEYVSRYRAWSAKYRQGV